MSEEDEKIIHRLKYYNDEDHLAKRIVELQHCIEDLRNQIQQKDNIIKEVREYIKFLKEHYEELRTSPVEDSYFINDMLRQMFIQSIENYLVCIEDILDKESDKNG